MKTILSHNSKLKILSLFVLVGSTVLVSDPIQRNFLSEPFQFQSTLSNTVTKSGRSNKPDFAPDEIVIKFKPHISNDELFSRSRSLGFNVENVSKRAHFTTVKIASTETIEEAVVRAKRDPAVEYAEPKYYYYAQAAAPNDTDFGKLWGLNNTNQTITSPSYTTNNPPGAAAVGKDMNVLGAWDVTTSCSSIIVAVLDTGINYNHEDLADNMWDGSASCLDKNGATIGGGCPNHGWDFASGDNDPKDEEGHGSHVAGTIGAVGNNNKGISGVCQTAKLMSVRVLGVGGGSNASVADGIYFAVRNGAKVINMSLGGTQYSQLIYDAVEYAKTNDVVVVVAAGNENTDLKTGNSYPCKNNNTNQICIAALDQNYQRATFSNYDTTTTAANRTVDFGAPGTNIHSIFGSETTFDEGTSNYTGWTTEGSGGSVTWAYQSCTVGSATLKGLALPNDCSVIAWNFTPPYPTPTSVAVGLDRKVYKTFTIPANSTKVSVFHTIISDGEGYTNCFDYTEAYSKNATGSPFSSGTLMTMADYNRNAYTNKFCRLNDVSFIGSEEVILNTCMNSANTNCTVGYRFVSDFSTQNGGAIVGDFHLSAWIASNNSYGLYNGTSMATPNTAGVVALIRAYNPLLNNIEVIQKLIDGGTATASISANTKYGKSINANASAKHLNQVTGVTATLQ
ncbi:S8 family serine peptidase [Leptospira terpstrae]|uniref:Thermitase family protein n=1 Tax=Leptospira terpstrae serovar Hualin str. LT 11-33 = ATCC 700639 TaxID=1257025 RepID=N1VNB1_9LEPT|nr:S8 family serine peptidase [Leptospira terpstrae]EMY59928.1 thermitase family protein [Leptospira terpstrae serovar Hualin str. LT 11-33 = ATCC 700639]